MTRSISNLDASFLDRFADAWNAHDIDMLMDVMADDCVFELSVGMEPWGTRYSGTDEVRDGFMQVLKKFPDGNWLINCHTVTGDRGVSEWVFTATGENGSPIEVNGCDLFTFRDGKIAKKDTILEYNLIVSQTEFSYMTLLREAPLRS